MGFNQNAAGPFDAKGGITGWAYMIDCEKYYPILG